MKIKTINKTVQIQANADRVWQVLTEDRYTRQWYSEFKEGSHAETDWKEGSVAKFLDGDGCGMLGRIKANKPNQLLDIVYEGFMINGKEDVESADARGMMGAHETYKLSEKEGAVTLEVASDMAEDWYENMSNSWDKALVRFKSLAEGKE